MLKVANIIEDGRLAGPQLRILAVSKALQAKDIWTTVIHPTKDSAEFVRRLDQQGISHAAFPIRRLTHDAKALFSYVVLFPVEIYLLWRFFRRHRFDFVHCSGGYWQIKGLIAGKLAGCKVIWHINDTVMPERLRPLFLRAAQYFSDRLIFAAGRVREHYLAGASIQKLTFDIQAPVDCKKFDPNSVQADAGLMAHPGVKIVTVSNLNPWKGIEYFLQMAVILNREFPSTSFHIVGPLLQSQAKYVSQLKSFIESNKLVNVHLHGASDDIAGILKAADVFVCCSVAEASPTAVWEAMAMSKAIVSTDVGDVSRFVRHGYSGLVVPPRQPDALASSVAMFIRDPPLRSAYGIAARQIAKQFLDLEICVREHERAYEQACGR